MYIENCDIQENAIPITTTNTTRVVTTATALLEVIIVVGWMATLITKTTLIRKRSG